MKEYKLNISYDCGMTYSCKKESKDLNILIKEGKKLDEKMLRWYIEDEDKNLIKSCLIHDRIIACVLGN